MTVVVLNKTIMDVSFDPKVERTRQRLSVTTPGVVGVHDSAVWPAPGHGTETVHEANETVFIVQFKMRTNL